MNMGSILVYSSNAQKREEKINDLVKKVDENLLNEDHPDRLSIIIEDNKGSVGITQIRKLTDFLTTKPYSSKYKVVTINPADRMTIQAQNALLKTLEEPPYFAILILSAKTERSLLPTVLSRCRKIKADGGGDDLFSDSEDVVHFNEILSLDTGKKLKLAESLSKKDNQFIVDLMELWVKEERFEMTEGENFNKHKNIEMVLELLNDIENTNVNKRLALETLFMNV